MSSENKDLPWFKKGPLYQIYPRSFKDSNADGVGDLRGIINKLDYLAGAPDSLGVSAIWISPFYKSPMKDFGYDVSDYYSIDPLFGDMQDFEDLVNECNTRNLAVIMDFIPSHTSDKNAWFVASSRDRNNEKSDWYIWADPAEDGGPPNNWLSVFGGSAWEYVESRDQYYMHTFLSEQPDLNWRNPEVVSEMKNVLRFWISKGVSGFRTDAFPHVFKDPELHDEPSNPNYDESMWSWHKLIHTKTMDLPELAKLYDWFEQVFAEFPERKLFLLTEDFFADAKQLKWHYAHSNNEYFAPLNLQLPGMDWDAKKYQDFFDNYYGLLEDDEWPNITMGNHDNKRMVDRIGVENIRAAALMLMTLRGLPVIYYGEELGLSNVVIPPEKAQDPFELRDPNKGNGRDPQRTPMQWNSDKWAGFSETEPWLPLGRNYAEQNVDKLSQDSKSILNFYKELISLRSSSTALQTGAYAPFATGKDSLFSYWRKDDNSSNLIILNFDNNEVHISLPTGANKKVISTDNTLYVSTEYDDALIIHPNSGIILEAV